MNFLKQTSQVSYFKEYLKSEQSFNSNGKGIGFIPGNSKEGWVATGKRKLLKLDEPVTHVAKALL